MMNKRLVVIVGLVVVLIVAVWLLSRKDTEGFANIGDISNVGSIESSYEMLPAAELDGGGGAHFADLVDAGDQVDVINEPQNDTLDDMRPMERLSRIQGSQSLPRISSQVTPYNVDVADPATHLFSVNAPRVQLKNYLAMRADPFRGDIPITYFPNIALIGKSNNGRDSQRFDGFFSDHYRELYNKYTGGGMRNMPIRVVNEETIGDFVS